MTALILAGSILLLLFLLLCAPLSVQVRCAETGAAARVRYLVFRYDFSADTLLGKRAKTEEEGEPREKKKKAKKERKKAKVALSDIWDLIRSSRRGLSMLRRHLVFSRVRVSVAAASGDAHRTAVLYGQLCALAAVSVEILDSLFVLKTPDLLILPDFTAEKTRFALTLRISIRAVFLLLSAAGLFYRFLRLLAADRKRAPASRAGQT